MQFPILCPNYSPPLHLSRLPLSVLLCVVCVVLGGCAHSGPGVGMYWCSGVRVCECAVVVEVHASRVVAARVGGTVALCVSRTLPSHHRGIPPGSLSRHY